MSDEPPIWFCILVTGVLAFGLVLSCVEMIGDKIRFNRRRRELARIDSIYRKAAWEFRNGNVSEHIRLRLIADAKWRRFWGGRGHVTAKWPRAKTN